MTPILIEAKNPRKIFGSAVLKKGRFTCADQQRLSLMRMDSTGRQFHCNLAKSGEIFTVVTRISGTQRCFLILFCIALLITGSVSAFTADSLEITVDKSGDAVASFHFTLEGMLENAIPQSMLQEELMKGLSTSSEPPELISMDRSSATIRMKKFADTSDVPTGTEYRTASMNFKKAEIALQNSALSSVVTADFSPAVIKVSFPDSFSRSFDNVDVLPSVTHIIIDPAKAAKAAANASAAPGTAPNAVPTTVTTGAIKVISSPAGVNVAIDGKDAGPAPATFADIPAGSHTLTFTKENYATTSKTVTVKAGQTIQISAFLAYVEPTTKPAPGFFGVLALAALVLCALGMRIRK
jgi:hypothetical protein